MREFKFRAWIKDENLLITDILGISFSDLREVLTYSGKIISEDKKDEIVLMQYTGLKDKNGKEIYEGDILGVTIERFKSNDYKVKRGKVVYEDGGFKVYTDNKKYNKKIALTKHLIDYFEIEVIGNIFENPELLGENNA